MLSFQQSLSLAVKTQMARENLTNKEMKRRLGWPPSSPRLANLLSNKTKWNSDELEPVAKALNLDDEWQLIDQAKQEQAISNQDLAA